MMKYLLAIAVYMASMLACLAPVSAKEPPSVVATIKPIHGLVAAVMQGAGEPRLLITGSASPHTFQMKPSDARALQDADVIFWVSEDLEKFLERPLASLPKTARVVRLSAAPGIVLLSVRESGAWSMPLHSGDEHDADGGKTHGHRPIEHGGFDMHIWLDVENARAIIRAVADALTSVDPERAALYRDNRERTEARIAALDQSLRAQLTPVAGRPYVVFHDAYRYVEHRYGLTPIGSITISPDRQPSAQRVAAIRKTLIDSNAACIFSEPQFEPKLVNTLVDGTRTRIGVLDAEGGIGVTPGPDAYFTLMQNLGVALKACLGPDS